MPDILDTDTELPHRNSDRVLFLKMAPYAEENDMNELAIGRIVLVRRLHEGAESPAIVTHVFGQEQGMINCRLFTDSNANPEWVTSVRHFSNAHEDGAGPSWRWHHEQYDDGVRTEGDQPERDGVGVQ